MKTPNKIIKDMISKKREYSLTNSRGKVRCLHCKGSGDDEQGKHCKYCKGIGFYEDDD